MIHDFEESTEFTDDMSFGDFLRKKRRLLGLNQTDLAEMVGVQQTTISMWELGITSPPIETAREIIRRLGGELRICNVKVYDKVWYRELLHKIPPEFIERAFFGK